MEFAEKLRKPAFVRSPVMEKKAGSGLRGAAAAGWTRCGYIHILVRFIA